MTQRVRTAVLVVVAVTASLVVHAPAAADASGQTPSAIAGEVVVEFVDDFVSHSHGDGDGDGGHQPNDHASDVARQRALEIAEEIKRSHRGRFSAEANERAVRNSRRGGRSPTGMESPATDIMTGGSLSAGSLSTGSLSTGSLATGLTATGVGAAVTIGGFTIVYSSSRPTPSIAKPAIEAGVAEWAGRLSTNGAPVTVEVSWESFGSTELLGYGGPTGFFSDPSLPTGGYYPAALTNVLAGFDVNGANPEIMVALNSDLAAIGDWYYGTGTPGSNQVDLATVVAHELGHGVGFVSSATKVGGTINLASPAFVFDSLMQYQGTPVPNIGNVTTALTSGNADIKISSGQKSPLHVPSIWASGSSSSHFSETNNATASSLMAPRLMWGKTNRSVDGRTLGVLDLMGWPAVPGPIRPSITSTSVSGTSVTVNWTTNHQTSGLPADSFHVEAYVGSTRIVSSTVGGAARSTVVSGLRPDSSQQVWVVPIRNGQRGQPAKATVTTSSGPTYGGPGEIPSFIRDRPLDHQVFRVYQAHFLRAPQQAGFTYWFDQRARGAALLTIISQFQSSTEFVNRYGSLSNGQFVQLVYRNVMGREADSRGYNHWTAQLASGVTRAEMMYGFVESDEYIRRTSTTAVHSPTSGAVQRLYQAYFLRQPSASHLTYWQTQVDYGGGLTAASNYFATSTEFTNTYGNLSNSQFVALVYQNVLGRPADSGGFNNWTAQLAAGMSRGEVMLGFSESAEFIKATGTMPGN